MRTSTAICGNSITVAASFVNGHVKHALERQTGYDIQVKLTKGNSAMRKIFPAGKLLGPIVALSSLLMITGCGEENAGNQTGASVSSTQASLKAAGEKAKEAASEAGKALKQAGEKALEASKEAGEKAVDLSKDAASKAGETLKSVGEKAKEAGKEAADKAGDALQNTGSKIREVVK